MKRHAWLVATAAILIALSAVVYCVHYLAFRDVHHIFIYLVGDIAFVPIEVLLVVLVLERVLSRREKRLVLQKLNMVIGTFFSELGTELLGTLTEYVENRDELRSHLDVQQDWSARDFKRASDTVRTSGHKITVRSSDLQSLRKALLDKRGLLLALLANPNLLEHERFTDLLWAVFHLTEELVARGSLDDLPETDLAHIAGDIKRAYSQLTVEWLLYCQHLQKAYPYIFSIVVRTHPLQEEPCPVVK